MSMLLTIRSESDLLWVDARGRFSLKEARRTFLEMLEAAVIHKSKNVLFDGRRLLGKPETMERFYYGVFAAQTVASFADRGVSPVTQFAYVLKEPVLDPHRFGENVAVNRGMLVKAFDNTDDAIQWLGIGSDSKLNTSKKK